MRYLTILLLLGLAQLLHAQTTVFYCIKNQQTIGNTYQFDIYAKTNVSGTLLGDGIVYLDYNTTAFGNNVVNHAGMQMVRDNNGSILGAKVAGIIYIYSANGLLVNDNTPSRFAIAWEIDQQSFAGSLTTSEQLLLQVQLNIVSTAEAPSVSFYEPLMENETYESTNANALNVDITTCGVLPVEGLRLQASQLGERKVRLQWQTQREINADYFSVEREDASLGFVTLAQQDATGTAYQPQTYQYLDERPLFPVNRYRVSLLDQAGTVTHSNVVEVLMENGREVRIYPNPTRHHVNIEVWGAGTGDLHFQLYDLQGKELLKASYRWKKGEVHEVALGELAEGVYLYRLSNEGRHWSGRLSVFD
jgi:hypothetical protein